MSPSIRRLAAPAAALLAALVAAGCGGSSDASSGDGKLSLVAYSTPQEAYQELIAAFQKTSAGKGARFAQSYGASGDQARAVMAGLKADVVALSLEPDITKLVGDGLVAKDWNAGRDKGIVTDSVVVFAVRHGNPKHIRTWDDLLRKDVDVIAPNPVTSGGARWNVMAAYGAQRKAGKSDAEAIGYVQKLLANVSVQDKSAREALQTFSSGKGDVLLAYENEAITAKRKGIDLDYVIPDATIRIENPIAVTTNSRNPVKAKAFLSFLRTPPAQRIFASKGYRPVLASLLDRSRFPVPRQLFTIADLGGWARNAKRFFDAKTGIVTKLNERLGVPSEK